MITGGILIVTSALTLAEVSNVAGLATIATEVRGALVGCPSLCSLDESGTFGTKACNGELLSADCQGRGWP